MNYHTIEYYGALAAQYVSAANNANTPYLEDFYTQRASEYVSFVNKLTLEDEGKFNG